MASIIPSVATVRFFFKQKTAYEIPKRDWSSDVCSSDLKPNCNAAGVAVGARHVLVALDQRERAVGAVHRADDLVVLGLDRRITRVHVALQALRVLVLAGGVLVVAVDLGVRVARHALLVGIELEALEVRRARAAVTAAARLLGVLELELELGARAVVEVARRELRPARWMAGLALGRRAELAEPIAVVRVLGVAQLARAVGPDLAERLGVALLALELAVRRAEVEPRALGVIEHLRVLERLEGRRVAPLARPRAEQMPGVRALVTARVAARVRLLERQLEHVLGVALGARHVLVLAEQRHPGVLAVVVVELHRLGRLPHALAVAALALRDVLAHHLVRLILGVAAAAAAVGAHEGLEALLVLGLVAVVAVGRRVLALELPAGQLVIEALLAALDRRPAHDVVVAGLVLVMARLALLALDHRRGVEALARRDPRAEVLVVVALEALVVRQLLAVADVAVVAAVLLIERAVARAERSRRAAEELVGGGVPGQRERPECPQRNDEPDLREHAAHLASHGAEPTKHVTTRPRCEPPRNRRGSR